MQNGLVGALVLRHVEGVVVFLGEGDGARHDGARAEFAGDPHGEAVAVLLLAVDRAYSARVRYVLRRYLDAQELLLAAVAATELVLRVDAFDRKIALRIRTIQQHGQSGADGECQLAAARRAAAPL